MMTMSPLAGLPANWTFTPPPVTSIFQMMRLESCTYSAYSGALSVCDGATTIESPVCTPIASMFSIEVMMMTLSTQSRITSNSISFHPKTDCSTSTCPTGLMVIAFWR